MAAAGASGNDNAASGASGKGQGKGGKFKPTNGQWNSGKAASGGAAGSGPQTAAKAGQQAARVPPPRFNGLAVCFAYNQAAGCARQKQGPQACVDAGGTVYAHVCNWFVKGIGGQQGNYCMATHSKVGNH